MMTEADKIKERILPLLKDKSVLDLGCGNHPVVPWAQGLDDSSESKILVPGVHRLSIDPSKLALGNFRDFDVVFSSHAIEHMKSPILDTLRYWLSSVKQGGRLILYLPDERRYVFNPKVLTQRNPGHHHYLTPETFTWYLEQLPIEIETIEDDPVIYDHYSFLVIARKR